MAVTLAGVQFGWIVVLGALLGALLHVLREEGKVRFHWEFVVLIAVFGTLGLVGALTNYGGRLDRLATLLALLALLALLIPRVSRMYSGVALREGLAVPVVLGGGAVLVYLVLLIISGDAQLARGNELSVALGENESSPSTVSRVLAFALTCSALLAVGAGVGVSTRERLGWVLVSCLFVAGMVYTGSRMPLIAAGTAIVMGSALNLVFGRGRVSRGAVIAVAIVSSMVLLFIAGLSSGVTVVAPFMGDGELSLRIARPPMLEGNLRLLMWSDHFARIDIAPWMLGSGVGVLRNPHSVWVGTLATFGLIGLTAVAAVLIRGLVAALRQRSAIGVGLLIYLAVAFSSSSDVDRPQFWILYAAVLSIVFADRMSPHHQSQVKNGRKLRSGVPCVR